MIWADGGKVVHWFKARGMDLLDVFAVGADAGVGVKAQAYYGLGVWGLGMGDMYTISLGGGALAVSKSSLLQSMLHAASTTASSCLQQGASTGRRDPRGWIIPGIPWLDGRYCLS